MVLQVHKLGKDYMKWVHSPVNRELKLFDSNFVEFFSKTPWYVIPLVWLPVIMILSVISMMELHGTLSGSVKTQNGNLHYMSSLGLFGVCFSSGIPLWTLVEYALHRYLFHIDVKEDSPLLITLHFFLHGLHHKVLYFYFHNTILHI